MDVNGNTDKLCLIRGLRHTESVSSSRSTKDVLGMCFALRASVLTRT